MRFSIKGNAFGKAFKQGEDFDKKRKAEKKANERQKKGSLE